MTAIAMNTVRTTAIRKSAVRTSAAPVRSRLRMTRRGRAVLLGLVATPLVIIALVAGINAGGATATGSAPLSTVTVTAGETLWQVATQIAPKADPRDVIADILSVNKLASTDLQPGEKLKIPAQY
jgi:LysM repeat protein